MHFTVISILAWRLDNLAQSEALGHGWISAFHAEDREAVISELKNAAASQSDFDMEFRIQHYSGKVVTVRAISRPIVTPDGTVCGHIGSVEDVSERMAVQHVLSEERLRFRSIIEGTRAGTWEWNIQTGEILFNNRWAEMLGMTLDELQPTTIQKWYGLAHPEDCLLADKLLDLHLSGESDIYDCEHRLKHKDGHWV